MREADVVRIKRGSAPRQGRLGVALERRRSDGCGPAVLLLESWWDAARIVRGDGRRHGVRGRGAASVSSHSFNGPMRGDVGRLAVTSSEE